MKILITAKMDDAKLFTKIFPLSTLDSVDSLDVVRDASGKTFSKVVYHVVPKWGSKFKPLKIILKFFLIVLIGRRRDMDVILSYYLFPYGIIGFLCSRIINVPNIISLLGSDLDCLIRKSYLRSFNLFILRRSNAIIVRGTKTKKYLVENGLSEKKIFIMNNHIDLDLYKPRSIGKKRDVISVGYLRKEKRYDILVEVMKTLKSKDFNAIIVGNGPLTKSIEDSIERADMNARIEMIGYRPDVEKYYNNSRLYVLTSEREGLPQTLLEAMACGLPCVVSDVGDISDVVVDNFNGFLVEPLNVRKFSIAIKTLLEDETLYQEFSKNAAKNISDNFSLKAITDEWKKLFEMIFSRKYYEDQH